jgi:hypothetical protein
MAYKAPRKTKLVRAEKPQRQATDGQWWSATDERNRGIALWDTLQTLKAHHRGRQMQDALYVGMHEGKPPYWLGQMSSIAGLQLAAEVTQSRPAMNVIRQVNETAASQLAKNSSEVRATTSGGTWSEQKRAKTGTKYISGAFNMMEYSAHRQRAFEDGCLSVAGGWVKFIADSRLARVTCERVPPRTMLWNDLEGSDPWSLYQDYPMARTAVIRMFPEHEALIMKAPPSAEPISGAYSRRATGLALNADMIDVGEAWYRAPDEKTPGKHLIMVENAVLNTKAKEQDWKHLFHPFARFTWADEHEGFSNLPLTDALVGYQVRLAKWMRKWMKGVDMVTVPRVWLQEDADIDADQISDEVGGIGRYRANPPTIGAASPFPPDFYQGIWKLKEEAFAEAGFSIMSAQGQKPAGIDSGEALTAFSDITSTRHVLKQQRLERMDIKAARITFALSKDLYAGNKALRVLAPGTRFLEEVPWSEFGGDGWSEDEGWIFRVDAVSSLPTHVVGRIDAVTKIIKSGIMPAEEVQNGTALRLLNFPDLEKHMTLITANQELAQMQVDQALYEGEYIPPEPFQDLSMLKVLAQRELVYAKTLKDVPDQHLEFLSRLLFEADAMQKRATPPPAPAPLQMAAPPPGLPPGAQPIPPMIAPAVPLPGEAPMVQ